MRSRLPGHTYPSIYQPLADTLANCADIEVVFTFTEIEAIIGRPLSVTAHADRHWWSGKNHPHTRAWRALGWRARLEQPAARVRFTHVDGVGKR